ncbi:leucine-rich repeat domain-containing protein [Collinsella provencensis]|uniref:leucine-rich repeat domain-containing protein n=1 Tax=Collinsella provencensis TaxID=1937461 RepID=UPI000C81A8FD|nr:leucine-rich repeat domain-containing protein [Collinsella provencensis]
MIQFARKARGAWLAAGIVLVAVFALAGVKPAYAAEVASGTGWTLDDAGTITLTADVAPAGSGQPYEWAQYAHQIKEVRAAEGVTTIPRMAFASTQETSYSELRTFVSPSTLKTVGGAAFEGTSSLTEVSLNDGLEELQVVAFSGTGIREISIPENVKFGSDVFTYCTNLERATIGGGATWDGNAQFHGCANLKTLILEEGTTAIPNQFVNGCDNLAYVWIPRSVTTIDGASMGASWETWGSPILNGCIIGYSGTISEKYVERWDGKHGYPGSYPLSFHAIDGEQHEGAWQTVSAPTCIASGQEKLVCSICGTEQVRGLAATGHVWDGGAVTKEPTAHSTGVKTYTCSVCGEKRSETIPDLSTKPGQDDAAGSGSGQDSQDANKGELPQTGDGALSALVPLALSALLFVVGPAISATKEQRS